MILIGEKLNGFIPSVGKAIRSGDETFLCDLAVRQEAAGADYLDVCAAVDSEIEAKTLRWLVELIQDTTSLPLCIDSPNPAVLAEVLPHCKRPGIVNSVSMESGKIETLFPIIAHSEWKVIALLSANTGVPEQAEGRLALFEQIRTSAQQYGISEERLLIDPVVHTLSTDENALFTFAACAKEIRNSRPEGKCCQRIIKYFVWSARAFAHQSRISRACDAGGYERRDHGCAGSRHGRPASRDQRAARRGCVLHGLHHRVSRKPHWHKKRITGFGEPV